MTTPAPIVSLNAITRTYLQGKVEVHAIRDLSLTIEAGDFATLCGPSGSGKTTVLNLMGALDEPTSGTVTIEGRDLAQMSRGQVSELRRDRLGFVFQAYNLIPVLSAFENAEFVLTLQGVHPKERHDRVMAVLQDVGLEGLEQRRPDEMSGGQQQRVAIARAIVTRPAIVLADEPTANVDSTTAAALLDLMVRLNREHGTTFLFSTHDPLVIDRAQRVIHLRDGAIESDQRRTP